MEKTNKSEARLQIDLIDTEIKVLDDRIKQIYQTLQTYKAKLEVLKDRKTLTLNYLNSDND